MRPSAKLSHGRAAASLTSLGGEASPPARPLPALLGILLFRGKRAEVDHFASTPRRSVSGLLGGAAVCRRRPSRVARQAPPTHAGPGVNDRCSEPAMSPRSRVSVETVLRWHRAGKLPGGYRLNGSNVLRFDRDELETWLNGTRRKRRLYRSGPRSTLRDVSGIKDRHIAPTWLRRCARPPGRCLNHRARGPSR